MLPSIFCSLTLFFSSPHAPERHTTPIDQTTQTHSTSLHTSLTVKLNANQISRFKNTSANKYFSLPIGSDEYTTGRVIDSFEYPMNTSSWSGWGIIDNQINKGYFTIGTSGNSIHYTVLLEDIKYSGMTISNNSDQTELHNTILIEKTYDTSANQINSTSIGYFLGDEYATSNTTVDHLIVYSNNLESNVGGTRNDAIAYWLNAMATINLVYATSGVSVNARLAYAYSSDLPGSFTPTLSQLRNTNNGIVDEIDSVRSLVQADLGSYYRYVGLSGSPTGISAGYNTLDSTWLHTSTAFLGRGMSLHELGHSMGVAHGIAHTSQPHNSIPYAYGYCLTTDSKQTIMIQPNECLTSGSYIIQYSNPNNIYLPTGEVMGIANVVDAARGQSEAAANHISNFRTESPIYPDFDGDGILDVIEIAHGDTDCDKNTIPDSNEIEADPALDCNANGVLDSCEYDWDISSTATYPTVQLNSPIFVNFERRPDSDVLVQLKQKTSYRTNQGDTHEIELFVNGTYMGLLFEEGVYPWNNNCTTEQADAITILYDNIPTPVTPDTISIELRSSTNQFIRDCNDLFYSEASVVFQSISPVDDDRDGIINCDDPSCNPSDVNEDGVLNNFDVSQFSNWYNTQDPQADIAAPLGVWDFFDWSKFMATYGEGCP